MLLDVMEGVLCDIGDSEVMVLPDLHKVTVTVTEGEGWGSAYESDTVTYCGRENKEVRG